LEKRGERQGRGKKKGKNQFSGLKVFLKSG
jgi:hypothetical protein